MTEKAPSIDTHMFYSADGRGAREAVEERSYLVHGRVEGMTEDKLTDGIVEVLANCVSRHSLLPLKLDINSVTCRRVRIPAPTGETKNVLAVRVDIPFEGDANFLCWSPTPEVRESFSALAGVDDVKAQKGALCVNWSISSEPSAVLHLYQIVEGDDLADATREGVHIADTIRHVLRALGEMMMVADKWNASIPDIVNGNFARKADEIRRRDAFLDNFRRGIQSRLLEASPTHSPSSRPLVKKSLAGPNR